MLRAFDWQPIDARRGRLLSELVRSGREEAVERVLQEGIEARPSSNFELALLYARLRFNRSSLIEIKGCRIGQDRAYLEAASSFFGWPGSGPTVTGPDMFEIFGHMGWVAHPNNPGHLRGLWNIRPLQQAFVYWAGVFGWPLSDPPISGDLIAALQAGHAFPVGFVLHYLQGRDPGNVVEWFARFGYRLGQSPDSMATPFTGRTTPQAVQFTIVDWLQDRRFGERPMQFIFPPDPAYQAHIESAQAP